MTATAVIFSPEKEARRLFALLRNTGIDGTQFEKVTESITEAISEGLPVCVDGEGRSLDVALGLKSMLLGLGAHMYRAREPPPFRRGSRYIAISGSGATVGPLKRMKLAKDAGMETILITENADQPKNGMARMADRIIELPSMKSQNEEVKKDRHELAGATSDIAPMGTIFEDAAFVSCQMISVNAILKLVGNAFIPELAALGKGGFREQYERLLDVAENGGEVSGTRINGLVAEAAQAADMVGQFYNSKREIEKMLVAKKVPADVAGQLARELPPEVILAGEGVANYTLEMFAQRLYHISFRAHTTSGTVVPPITKGTLVVALSCSGESSAPVTAAKIASMKEAWFSAITSSSDSSLAKIARGAGMQSVRLSSLQYIKRVGFEERRFGQQLSVPDPVFSTKALLLLDSVIAREISLLGLAEGELTKRHQQDKAEYL